MLRGQAGPALLETYSTERAPVAERIVKRANQSGRDPAASIDADAGTLTLSRPALA